MKLFLKKAAAFLLIQTLIFTAFWSPKMPYEHNYIAATIDKHDRLRSTPSPRLILIGGSNLAFGIKSKILEDETGRSLVNMGLHCGLGITFMLREVQNEIRSGDVIVLSFEHDIFAATGKDLLSRQLLEVRPASLLLFPPAELVALVDNRGFSIVGGVARRTLMQRFEPPELLPEGTYKRDLFDAQGSYLGHYGRASAYKRISKKDVEEISETIRHEIELFAKRCREVGALCFFSCPPHPDPALAQIRDRVESNLSQLRSIPNLVVLDTPLDHSYPERLFYDSAYHLSEEGAEHRTRKVAQALSPFLNETRLASREGSPQAH